MSNNCATNNDTFCHSFDYYTSQSSIYFASNTTLIFTEGNHLLTKPILITGVENFTLLGQGRMYDGEEWTLRESTVKIQCNDSKSGLLFANWTNVRIDSITFAGCGVVAEEYLLLDILTHYSSFQFNWTYSISSGLNKGLHSSLFMNGTGLML